MTPRSHIGVPTFTGPRTHRQVPNAGHNIREETPDAFAGAVLAGTRAANYDIDGGHRLVG